MKRNELLRYKCKGRRILAEYCLPVLFFAAIWNLNILWKDVIFLINFGRNVCVVFIIVERDEEQNGKRFSDVYE